MNPEFCGSAFWDLGNYSRDENGTLINHNSGGPDLTECFKDTALVWIPCGFLFLTTPFYLLFQKKPKIGIPHTWLNLTKSVLSVALMILTLIDVGYRARERLIGYNLHPAHLLAAILNFFAMTFSLVLIQYGRRKALRKTGVLFLYWLLQTIATILILQSACRSAVSAKKDESYTYHLIYVSVFLALVFIQFLLSAFFTDKDPKTWNPQIQPYPSPEASANFLSTISFWWFNRLMLTGYKKALVQEDLWSLNLQDMSNSIVSKFMNHWSNNEEKLHNQKAKETRNKRVKGKSRDKTENMKITRNGSIQLQLLNVDSAEVKFKDGRKSLLNGEKHNENRKQLCEDCSDGVTIDEAMKKQYPRLWIILTKTFYKTYLFASFLKLIHDILIFCNPLLLKQMIQFVQNKSQPVWYGYTYTALLFSLSLFQSCLLHQYYHRTMITGMRIRTALIACIYRKSLRMSNSARKTSTVGEIVNLMSVDAQRFMELMTNLNMIWSAPFQICVCLYFLWWILGPSVLAGVGVMFLLIPVNAWIAKKSRALLVEQMKFKDSRIKLMNEILNGIKVLKLYAWELSFQKKILGIRAKELKVLRRAAYLNAAGAFTWNCAPFLVALSTFAVYVLSDSSNILDPIKAFVSLSLFNILRHPLTLIPIVTANIVQSMVSLKRLQKFLSNEELEDDTERYSDAIDSAVEICDGTFSWDKTADLPPTLDEINVKVKVGSFVGIVGQVGCGKSTLLAAMLGETDKINGSVAVKGSVAYVAQQAWIQNATLENNILFGAPKRSADYENVIDACALRPDIADLAGGDQTEIGEKGINLSGGQKQRVSLARAAYFDADTYLFDDPLSAVDAHVGKHIFDQLLGKNGLLKNKTRVLVTHGISYLSQLDQIIVMLDGRISEVGTYQELLKQNGAFAEFLRTYLEKEELGEDDVVSEQDLEIRSDILSRLESIGGSCTHISQNLNKLHRVRRETSISSEGSSAGTPINAPASQSTTTNPLHRANGKSVDPPEESDQPEETDSKSKLLDGTTAASKLQYMHSMSKESRKSKRSEAAEKNPENKRLIMDERSETGRVEFRIFWLYFKAIGFSISLAIVFLYICQNSAAVYSNIWLSNWSNDELVNGTVDIPWRNTRLGVYSALGLSQGIIVLITAFLLAEGIIRSCSKIHLALLVNNLRQPMSFFDSTPLGRIMNRFAKDIDVIDTVIPRNLDMFYRCFFAVMAAMFVVCLSTPLALIAVIPLCVLYVLVQRFYVTTSRQLRRIESVQRSPIYSHFGETIQGAMTIRAYKQQQKFIDISDSRVDASQISYYSSICSHRWLAVRLEALGSTLVMFAALFGVINRDSLSGGSIGLSISYALNITQTLYWMVRLCSELENNIVAVERVNEYSENPTEAEWIIEDKRPDKQWPEEGVIEFKNYSMRYRENLDPVLKSVSFVINSGEKIGIVGRTGAGKSSLTIGLFRIIEPCGGSVYIDGVDISTIGLHDLRSKLTIIPQDPVLFSGTLRMNLDPFDECTDEELWNAVEHAHLKSMVSNLPDKLSHECTEGGENLSVGQRQLVCLARALLRRSKILVLDEATAAVDLETDDLIQSTIRTQFSDSTVLTIAHRINTIMDYTRVMVLDRGEVKEFDAPQNLLANRGSIFYGLAKDANIVE